jgi:hypothetical protein
MSFLPNEVIKLAKAVRKSAENYTKRAGDGHEFDQDLGGMCAIASRALWRVLKNHGYKPKFVHTGDGFHCWVELDGWILDVTATQFNGGMYDPGIDNQYSPVNIIRNKKQVSSVFGGKIPNGIYYSHERSPNKDTENWGTHSPQAHDDWIAETVGALSPR